MAMSVGGGGEDEPMMEINTTPLIDVMLVLLIMFIITLPVMTHAVKLDMPQSKNPPPPPVVIEPIQLEIDWDGTVIWNGTPVQLGALEGYFRVEAAKNPAARSARAAESARELRYRGQGAGARSAQWHAAHRLRRQRTIHGVTPARCLPAWLAVMLTACKKRAASRSALLCSNEPPY